ncbi:hypothetical protein M1M86_02120, partial [Dehalococcoidales bacterium]|nr:hypothetical protein [Dehalococcoidales bacterium]
MKAKTLSLIVLAFLLVVGGAPVYATIPALPHAFYGYVYINDAPAPPGTIVEARGEGVIRTEYNPIITTEPGKYGGPGALDPKLVVQGNIEEGTIITFYVNG